MTGLGFNPVILGFALASLGYAIGLAFYHSPMLEGRSWGGRLISYSLVTAAFLAIAGSGQVLTDFAVSVSEMVAGQAGFPRVEVSKIPVDYFNLGVRAMGILSAIAAVSASTAVIPIVGPALGGILSVVTIMPTMALSGTMILSFLIAVFTTVFVTFAPVMIPIGVVLLSVPDGRLKGVGGWLIAMSLALTVVGPLIPGIGLTACGDLGCTYEEMSKPWSPGEMVFGTFEGLITFAFNPKGGIIMKMWTFALGSMIGLTILSVTATALSRAIGGVASSLGIG